MTNKDAEMLAKAICNEQDQRERDSKLVPSSRDNLRQLRTRMRENNINFSSMPPKSREENSLLSEIVYILGLLLILSIIFNLPWAIVGCAIGAIVLCLLLKRREKNMSKRYQTQWTKKKADKTSVWDIYIVMIIIIAGIGEGILWVISR